MASFKLLKWRLDEIETICSELQDRINIKDLWADKKIYAIAAVLYNTLDEVIRQKRNIKLIESEIKELHHEIEELGANCSMRHDDNI